MAACDLYDGRHDLAREIVGKPIPTTRRYQELLEIRKSTASSTPLPTTGIGRLWLTAATPAKMSTARSP